jgi:hypothetical protein
MEEQPVAVGAKIEGEIAESTVHDRPQVYRGLPAIVWRVALCHPEVEFAEASRSSRCEEEAQAVLGDGWVRVAERRVDDGWANCAIV